MGPLNRMADAEMNPSRSNVKENNSEMFTKERAG
jgi:hypothetical protein